MSRINGSEFSPNKPSQAEIQNQEGQLRNISSRGVFDTRPIFSQPTIITSPPSNQRGPNRRPIPVITSDWISTPRSQLSVLSGTYFLSGVEQLEVQRIVDLSTLLGTYNKGNQYKVKVPRAETIFLAIESSTESQRRFLKSSRPFTLNILDPSGETAYTIKKKIGWGCLPGWLHLKTLYPNQRNRIFNKVVKCLPGWLHNIRVESNEFIGSVEQSFTFLGPSFTIYDAIRNPLCHIEGPNVYACCMYKEALFQVLSVDGTYQMASVIRKWDDRLGDYILLLTFPEEMNIKLKSLLLGATFLIEYVYFEHQ